MKIITERLTLIAADIKLLFAEMKDLVFFGKIIGTEVPAAWPPDLYDRPAQEFTLNYLKENADGVGWMLWYLVFNNSNDNSGTLIGTCGYKGKPSSDGTVEIGYSILPEYQRKGYASEAVKALLKRAFSYREVARVIAETYPELLPSIRVLEKNGFVLIGDGSEPGIIRFELTRAAHLEKKQAKLQEKT